MEAPNPYSLVGGAPVAQEGEELGEGGRGGGELQLLHVARARERVQVARALLPVRAAHALQRHRLHAVTPWQCYQCGELEQHMHKLPTLPCLQSFTSTRYHPCHYTEVS